MKSSSPPQVCGLGAVTDGNLNQMGATMNEEMMNQYNNGRVTAENNGGFDVEASTAWINGYMDGMDCGL